MVKIQMNKKSKKTNKYIKWKPCPMGYIHDEIIECYYFGLVKIVDCNKCFYRK